MVKKIKLIFILIGIISSCYYLTEFSLRKYYEEHGRTYVHPIIGMMYKPNLRIERINYSGKKFIWDSNNLGFRGDDIYSRKERNEIRIFFLGGSSIDNSELNSKDIWPALLKNKLSKEFPGINIKVINAGIGGGTSFQSYLRFSFIITKLQPDIVVIYDGINDVVTPFVCNLKVLNYKDILHQQQVELFHDSLMIHQLKSYLYPRRSALLRNNINNNREVINYTIDNFINNINNLIGISKQNLIYPIIVRQINLYDPQILHNLRGNSNTEFGERGVNYEPGLIEEGFLRLNERLASYAVYNKLNYIDIRDKCIFEKRHFRDVIHFTEEGEKVFSELLFPEFVKHIAIFLKTKNNYAENLR